MLTIIFFFALFILISIFYNLAKLANKTDIDELIFWIASIIDVILWTILFHFKS